MPAPTARELELMDALQATLEWIDAVPQETVLPLMPGFDRDWVDGLIDGVKREAKAAATVSTEPSFITEYKAAYAAANPDLALPQFTKGGAGWYDMTPYSGQSYRRADIERMTHTLQERAARKT